MRVENKRARFPTEARLHSPSEFKAVLKGKILSRGIFFSVKAADSMCIIKKAQSNSRLGLIFSKKFAHRAVVRNLIKRIIRESFRKNRHIMPINDYVVRLHSKITTKSLIEIKKIAAVEINNHFYKISKCKTY
ncbi:ribonuclease P protein component [Candidatus Kinetoplastibacterium oncopeltii TCC290E]|uniref:Ribonuclease P protein component n=1 Tax=Candidatus Kinetoplastidibacterium stringomonadis TCC290E TaxID=1208920 RepID=M1M9W5_9PROT|nr:ribonuclease P protein component [Candidatus Kinetoplastibacterium oncopeltii]AGF48725.1 ribonuclease P protein component [Candidatus Kinetoplastibacterium oncopeltii TCC290E]